jgi:hypothetical protein
MRSAVRRATVATTAISTVFLLGACNPTTGSADASSGSSGTPTAASASASTPAGVTGTTQSQPSSPSEPTQTTEPTHAAPSTAASLPVLGAVWASGVQGYGHVRPTGLSNGGDPTGIVTNLSWTSWGGTSATGTGSAEYVAPGQSVAQGSEQQAKVVAFDLGMCNGKRAYRAIEWYFPGQGQHFDPAHYFDACTGQDHGM